MEADAIDLHRHENFAFFHDLPVGPCRKSRQHGLKTGVENGGM